MFRREKTAKRFKIRRHIALYEFLNTQNKFKFSFKEKKNELIY